MQTRPAETKPAAKPRQRRTPVQVVGIGLQGDTTLTRLTIDSNRPLAATTYVLADPYRVVIDIADAEFRVPHGMAASPVGLATGVRFGLLDVGQSRIVVDVAGPVSAEPAVMPKAAGGPLVHSAIDIRAVDAAKFVASPVPSADAAAVRGSINGDRPAGPRKAKPRPVVVIDPGHGGLDPGAVAAADLLEKNVVLAVARAIAAHLKASGKVAVVLTRSSDVFVSLSRRIAIAREAEADLFISIHADAVAEAGLAHTVRGASIYTLAETASDERARLLAEKENGSDIAAGLTDAGPAPDAEVRNILFDLMLRETHNFSRAFQMRLADQLKGGLTLGRDPLKSASFKVLRQPQTPAVLVELGYMSHVEDQKLLRSPEWQGRVAQAIARAIEAHFAQR